MDKLENDTWTRTISTRDLLLAHHVFVLYATCAAQHVSWRRCRRVMSPTIIDWDKWIPTSCDVLAKCYQTKKKWFHDESLFVTEKTIL